MKRRAKNTPKASHASTVTPGRELADDHFQKLARKRLAAEFKELGIELRSYTIGVPFEVRADELVRRALYGRRRGRVPSPETASVIRAEVQRQFEKHTDPAHAVNARKASERFWMDLPLEERYSKYRIVVKDHKKTIEACLEGLL